MRLHRSLFLAAALAIAGSGALASPAAAFGAGASEHPFRDRHVSWLDVDGLTHTGVVIDTVHSGFHPNGQPIVWYVVKPDDRDNLIVRRVGAFTVLH